MDENGPSEPWIIIAQRRFEDLRAIEEAIALAAPNSKNKIAFILAADDVLLSVQESSVRPIVISGEFPGLKYAGDNLARLCKKIHPNTIFLQYSVFEDHSPSADIAIVKCPTGEHILIACLISELTETTTLDELKKILGGG